MPMTLATSTRRSFARFDMKTMRSITGRVQQFGCSISRAWLWLSVPNAQGVMTQRGIEGHSPPFLGGRRWHKNTLRAGDRVTVDIHPFLDAQKEGSFISVTLPDGKVMWLVGAEIAR